MGIYLVAHGDGVRNIQSLLRRQLAIIRDPILAALIVINPIVYGTVGRSASVTALSPIAAIAGLFTLFRVWKNLGPNLWTLLGGVLFFVLAMLGVVFLAVYNATDVEWIHALIGGSFVFSTIPLAVAILFAEDDDPRGGEGEEKEAKEHKQDEDENGGENMKEAREDCAEEQQIDA